MARTHATPSFSMSYPLIIRLQKMLPRYGDRSKLVRYLIEQWLDGKILIPGDLLRSNVASRNIKTT